MFCVCGTSSSRTVISVSSMEASRSSLLVIPLEHAQFESCKHVGYMSS